MFAVNEEILLKENVWSSGILTYKVDNDYIYPPPYYPLLLLLSSSSLFCACLLYFHFGPHPVPTNPKTT